MSEAHHPEFLDQTPYPAFVIRRNGSILAANAPACALLLYSSEQLPSLTIWDLIAPEQHALFQQTDQLPHQPPVLAHEWLMLDSQQKMIPVNATITRLQEDLLGIELRDLRPIKESRKSYQRQSAILRAVADASYQLFRSAQPDEVIPQVLAQLGEAADVSRVYLFENHWENGARLLTSQRYEWCAEGIEPQINNPNLQNFDYLERGFTHFYETLQRGEVLAAKVRDLPPAEQAELAPQGILSILALPIFIQRQFWGFIGFDECRSERTWKPYEVDTLRTAANLLGAFFERRKTETALRASEELYRLLIENQGLGVALVDEQENIIFANPETEKLFGVSEGGMVGRNLGEFLAPDQMQIVLEQTALRRKGFRSQYEVEIVLPNQQRRILSIHATPHFDEQGQFIGAFGVFNDITEQKRMEQRIRNLLMIEQSHRRESEALREAISSLIHDLSSQQAAQQVLRGLEKIIPYDRCALYLEENGKFRLAAKTGHLTSNPPAVLPADHPLLSDHLKPNAGAWFFNQLQEQNLLDLLRENTPGISWMVIPLKWNNRLIGLLWLVRDVSHAFRPAETTLAETFAGPAALSIQNSRLFTQARRLAKVDALTGLLNRRSIFEAGERELLRAQRYAEPFSLLVIDLDHFKAVNDRHGHLIGDVLLKKVARRMKSALRRSDLIGRPGGDEFIVLLVRTTAQEAVLTAERLLGALRERPYRMNGALHRITASIGVASVTEDAPTTLQNLIHRADEAMYAAKQKGGNQVQQG
ncbi:diguanylate cyclase [Bellilinea sp.]|uniref:sensor domain-containing diguanylate cyclase n=1 Tax=Bellilinea sp. TaxID=2838785 RepID=UPI002ADD66AA|nr:diguanylate cyclase [Bellilinea sp.]